MKVTRIAELPTNPTTVHYPANCAPLANVPMTSLPMGAVRAEGWLQYIRAGDMLPRIFWFYRHVPEQWVLDLIHKVYAKARPPWDEWLDHHAVNFPERLPNSGHYYQVSKEPYHLDQVEY